MKKRRQLAGFFTSIGLLIVILDGKSALEGAQHGVELCLKTVIPSLFPFFVLSVLTVSFLSGEDLSFLRPIGKLLGIPDGMESILIPAFLGGYPVGAQCVASAWKHGQLQKRDAERMLAFSSNAGPAFLFGMAAIQFPGKWAPWILWLIHILGAVFAAIMLKPERPEKMKMKETDPISITDALQSSLKVMANVCGWVILFRVLIHFLKRWLLWFLPTWLQILITGLLELSNGCCELAGISDHTVRFLICSMILGFGGLCVTLQTSSVTRGLSLRFYLIGKLLQTLFSLGVGTGLLLYNWLPLGILLAASVLFLRKKQKKSSIQATVGV